nr:MAG TPA: hypothetical protein [Caudoviricetes sp.]
MHSPCGNDNIAADNTRRKNAPPNLHRSVSTRPPKKSRRPGKRAERTIKMAKKN